MTNLEAEINILTAPSYYGYKHILIEVYYLEGKLDRQKIQDRLRKRIGLGY